jgi:twitching motility protein PilT
VNTQQVSANVTALNQILSKGIELGASDVHMKVAQPPMYRINGVLRPLQVPPLKPEDMRSLVLALLSQHPAPPKFETLRELDFSYAIPGMARFRVNVFLQKGTWATVIRIIQSDPPTIEQLKLPPILRKMALAERGLTLVTGATGSGKSSTLAAMIREINLARPTHILTIEDPIEYVHENARASVSQREVGSDTDSFHKAFRSALRQDPDVILVGEIRDEESVDMALKAAETGHMVYSTLHTENCSKTIGRLLALFPPEARAEVRLRLADALVGVISQRLLPRADGKGRVPAVEILAGTLAVKDAIRDPDKADKLTEYQVNGESYGMQTFDQHIIKLFMAGVISHEVARGAATSPGNFDREISLLQAGSGAEAQAARAALEGTGGQGLNLSFDDLAGGR